MKSHNPTSKGRRQLVSIEYGKYLTANEPWKGLVSGGKRRVGRNAFGRITTRHKGGGHKRLFRDVDFMLTKFDIPARVETIEYDPNRTAFIARIVYRDGERRYVLASKSMRVGNELLISEKAPVKLGNRMPLRNMPVGTFVYNVEIQPKGGAKLIRSAGNTAEIVAQDGDYTNLKMPSTEVRRVLSGAWATIGEVSNDENKLRSLGKAGRSRWLGIRPTVRGSVMNPVDHPHGGGEGRQGRGRRRAISIYGKPTGKGQKSRRPKKYSNGMILSRRRVGKNR